MDATPTTPPASAPAAAPYRLIYDPAAKAVLYLEPNAGSRYTAGEKFVAPLAQCEKQIIRLGLTPLPDPALAAAKAAKLTQLGAALKGVLIAQFESAPLGGQWQFDPLRAGCNAALEKGDLVSAARGLQDTLDHNLVPAAFVPLVTNCIGWIQAYGPVFAAAEAATTVAAAEAVAAPAPAPTP